jgi:hypothetical protein
MSCLQVVTEVSEKDAASFFMVCRLETARLSEVPAAA